MVTNSNSSTPDNFLQKTRPQEALWLCIYLPMLPIEVFTRGFKADERNRPIVILSQRKVSCLNRAAQDQGMNVGSSLDTALTLSSQVVSFERNEQKEFATLSHLAQWAYQFTPNVTIRTPNCLLLDISGCLKLFKGLKSLKSKIQHGLSRQGYESVLTTNLTPMAALCVAEGRPQPGKYKSGNNKPNEYKADTLSITQSITQSIAQSLQHLPVSDLQVDKKIIESLMQMGIADCKALFALPKSGLNQRFGIYFVDYLQRLLGEKPDPQKFINPEPRFLNDVTFLSDVSNTTSLRFPIKRLISELAEFLTARQLATNHLSWTLSHRSHEDRNFNILLASPVNEHDMFMSLTLLKLDQINDVKEIDNLSLTVNNLFPAVNLSGDLFHGTPFQQKDGVKGRQHQTDMLLNKLSTRLGPGSCYGLSIANDHRPEKAWKPVRLDQKDYWQPNHTDVTSSHEPARPMMLLSQPKPLPRKFNFSSAVSVTEQSPFHHSKHQLTLLKGPERIDFGWWDEEDLNKVITRDYYIATLAHQGSLLWVFQYSNDKQWYLHGLFS
jgi:protein ImuB